MNGQSCLDISIPSRKREEKLVLEVAAVLLNQQGFATKQAEAIKTALHEAVTNAIKHGNQFDPQLSVRISAYITTKSLTFSVRDYARRPFPPLPFLQKNSPRDNQVGLFLIQQLTDEIEIITAPQHNELHLTFFKATS